MNLNKVVLKIACLSVLMMGSGLLAMDIDREKDVEQDNQTILNALLIKAVDSSNIQNTVQLIAKGADVNAIDKYGSSALMWAVFRGQLEICKLLVAHGAHVNARDAAANTSLMWAVREGSLEICKFLIAHGADLYVQDKFGETPLILAGSEHLNAFRNLEEICKLLIKEMIKQEKKQARTVLYQTMKVHKGMGRDTARLVTQQLQESQKEKKAGYKSRAREEIMKINSTKLEKKLLDYLDSL
jgi:hypothetical protein